MRLLHGEFSCSNILLSALCWLSTFFCILPCGSITCLASGFRSQPHLRHRGRRGHALLVGCARRLDRDRGAVSGQGSKMAGRIQSAFWSGHWALWIYGMHWNGTEARANDFDSCLGLNLFAQVVVYIDLSWEKTARWGSEK